MAMEHKDEKAYWEAMRSYACGVCSQPARQPGQSLGTRIASSSEEKGMSAMTAPKICNQYCDVYCTKQESGNDILGAPWSQVGFECKEEKER